MNSLEILKKLGLTEYESKIAFSLMQRGTMTVKEISKTCTVPKNKIYESLQNLTNKGIADVIPSTPKKYFIKKVDAFSALLEEKEYEIKNLKLELKNFEKSSINSGFSSKEVVWIDYGHRSFINKVKEALGKTNEENFIVVRKIRNDPIVLRLTKSALKRGADIRIITQKLNKGLLKEWGKIGVKIKYLDNPPEATFSTFDNFLCRLNIELNNPSDPTLWIENPFFIQILKKYFESIWSRAKK